MHDFDDDAVYAYWRRLLAEADDALCCAGAEEYFVAVAERPVALRFAGPALIPAIVPALSHLAIDPAPPDLTVLVVDSATTGKALPAMPSFTATSQAWTLNTDRFAALHLPALDSVLWFNREDHLAIYWLPDAARCPLVERGSPLLTLWAWWLADRGLQLTHGAAIGGSQGAAILVGPGGSGKSTTALMSVGTPLRYLADDYCIVDPQLRMVHSLYCSGKVAAADRGRFPGIQSYVAGHDGEKNLYLFHPATPPIVTRRMPLQAMLAPTVTGLAETTLTPISAMTAVRAAAPSTVLQLRTGGNPGDALKRITALASRLPCHRLGLGTNLAGVVATLLQLLD